MVLGELQPTHYRIVLDSTLSGFMNAIFKADVTSNVIWDAISFSVL